MYLVIFIHCNILAGLKSGKVLASPVKLATYKEGYELQKYVGGIRHFIDVHLVTCGMGLRCSKFPTSCNILLICWHMILYS